VVLKPGMSHGFQSCPDGKPCVISFRRLQQQQCSKFIRCGCVIVSYHLRDSFKSKAKEAAAMFSGASSWYCFSFSSFCWNCLLCCIVFLFIPFSPCLQTIRRAAQLLSAQCFARSWESHLAMELRCVWGGRRIIFRASHMHRVRPLHLSSA
jgi:hypothetical protein